MTHDDIEADPDAWERIPLRPGWDIKPSAFPAWRCERAGRLLRVDDNLDGLWTVLWAAESGPHGSLESADYPSIEAAVHEAMRLAEEAADKMSPGHP